MKASKLRLKPLAWILSSGFTVWCVVVVIARDEHYMRRIGLNDPLMWPVVFPLVAVYPMICDWLRSGDERVLLPEGLASANLIFNIVFVFSGTLWHWLVGRIISFLVTAIFPRHAPSQS